jgi:hypothetical protein
MVRAVDSNNPTPSGRRWMTGRPARTPWRRRFGPPLGEETAKLHGSLLDDRRRTSAFMSAVERAVRPGDVVVDIGTGTGILALAAARSGAERVYAIEAGEIARYARLIFAANSVDDRVVLIERFANQVVLPERCDVLIAELIGHDPLAEKILSTVRVALRRFLKSDARLIPSGIRLHCVPVTLPGTSRSSRVLTRKRLERWSAWYGVDFSPLARATPPHGQLDFPETRDLEGSHRLGPPVLVESYEFTRLRGPPTGFAQHIELPQGGRLDGFAFHFELVDEHGVFLSTAPDDIDEANHWRVPLWILPTPINVQEGASMRLRFWRQGLNREPRCQLVTSGPRGCQIRPP